jgi:two-component system, cell cycle sensor histidine kinase and response regulator CckA
MPVIDDIDALKNAERALRESETRMRALLDASQDEILLVSTDGTVLAINKAARARLAKRIADSDPIGLRLDQLLPKDLAESRLTVVQQVAATATLAHLEQQIGAQWFEFWFYPVVRPDGGVSEVAVYAREITGRKQAEGNLRNLYQAIQQSPVSVMITDLKGRIEYVNPKFTEITGYTLAEAIGQNPRILKSGHTSPEEYAHLWETITSGGVWRGEFHNRKKNGELFSELALIAAVKDTEGNFTHFVAVKEDITARKATDEQLRQAHKLQAVGQLTGGIAHDFNNLLTIIIGNLQLLQEHLGGDIKIGEFLTDALWSAQRGAELTYQLLAFARRQPLHPEALNLNEVVEGMSDLLRRTLGAGIDIHVHLAPDLWEARADRGEIERALLNLAVNARDAMADGGVLTLETGNAVLDEEYVEQYPEVTAGDYVLFAVADTGTGMPPEILERVLEPFFTTKQAGKGSGLGLSMVYGFVKQSGGHLDIHSDVGHGMTVKLYLPRAATAVSHRDEAVAKEPDQAFAGKVVLVVEDEAKLTKITVHMLETLGFRVATAENATQALQRLEQLGRIDVLFTDLGLPGGMNGAELAEEVRRRHPDVHIICTTGYAKDDVLRNRSLLAGTPLITKPYFRSTLAQEFAAVLSKQRSDQNRP